ncbi:MAG TPA: hypothetical protein VNW73_04620 [Ktedonobacteraceae bacterium]|jgi:hypothetical protein|nr:hypothetical protein [Ktedonobacteraceae bacterium]
MQLLRKISLSGSLLLALLLITTMWVSVTAAAASPAKTSTFQTVRQISASHTTNSNADLLHRLVHAGRLAPTVHVLDSLPPTTIVQFPLVPSSIKKAFPQATGLVTIVRGDRDNAFSDTITVDVQNMPPNITFTIFYIEFASKPFGNVEYVADLTTRGDGSGETIFQNIAFVAFAMDARNPGTSQDGQEGTTSGINLEHMGMWFSQLQDAQKVLNDDTLKGTIFDGGNPPLHAGPQAMTDGQTAPVF